MKFYTSVIQRGRNLLVRGYDSGRRFSEKFPFHPYLFVDSKEPSEYKTIYGKSVKRMDFSDVYEAREFVSKYDDLHGFNFYGMERWPYVFIHDEYPGVVQYDISQIKVVFLDIETDSSDGFGSIELANKMLTAISVRLGNKKVVFGYNDFNPPEGVKYYQCRDERELISRFLTLWNEWSPDVVTGWNIANFDIPYLVNRITNVLGRDHANSLSPWGVLRDKDIFIKGKEVKQWTPLGIAVLDYLDLYKKYVPNQQSSYSLNNIAHIELGEKKIDYKKYSTLANLYKENHQLFLEYNIHDVDLVFKLEEKLRFIELVFAVAYDAKVNFEDAFTSVLLWDVIIYNYLADRNIVVPKRQYVEEREIEGGFVKEPIPGLYKWIMSYDAVSLYPKTIITYNISPETFVKKLPGWNVQRCLDETPDHQGYSMSASGCLFRKDTQGFLGALMEAQFEQRVEYKRRMKEAKTADEKIRWDKAQAATKIKINSLYGALGNVAFRFYNPDLAESVTLSGQLFVRTMERKINGFMNRICESEADRVIAIDTDSNFITFNDLVEKYWPNKTVTEVVELLDKVSKQKVLPFIEQECHTLAARQNAFKSAVMMNREVIADRGIWKAKKRYMLNVWDKEGTRYDPPTMKIMGIEVVSSSSPEICRRALEKAIQIILNGNEPELQRHVAEFKETFFASPFDEIAIPKGANGISKYSDRARIYKEKTPIQVRGAILFNKMLKERKIKTWEPIYDGEKVRYAYLIMPNPVKDNVIASTGFLPFDDIEEYIDYNMMWEKAFLDPITGILKLIDWHSTKPTNLDGLW